MHFNFKWNEEKLYKKMKLQSQEQIQTIPPTLKILTVTWNLVGSIPQQKYLKEFFTSPQFKQYPDVIFIGTQQCEISLFWAFFWDSKPQWQQALKRYLHHKYELLSSHTLQGLHSAVLILKSHKDQTSQIKKSVLRAGFCCNLFGNKGATQIKIKIYGQYIQFINCHLAPHQDNAYHRNQTLLRILNNVVCQRSNTQVILLGDMNYRIQMKNDQYKKFLKGKKQNTQNKINYLQMIDIQQLRNQQMLKDSFFPIFQQGEIKFPPSYKLDLYTDQYNHSRVPGWTDRIFNRRGKLRRLNYDCLYYNYGSDHRPVLSMFQLDIEEGLSLFQDEAFQTRNCQLI